MGPNKQREKRTLNYFIVNNILLVFGALMIGSGLVLQIGFHLGEHPGEAQVPSMQGEQVRLIEPNKIVAGFTHPDWSAIHKMAIVLFTLLMIYHLAVHWKWYKGVIKKHLVNKNKPVMILSVLFILATVTGFLPWMIDLSDGSTILRMHLIEIHDKITLLLIVFLLLHVAKRAKWFGTTYGKLTKSYLGVDKFNAC